MINRRELLKSAAATAPLWIAGNHVLARESPAAEMLVHSRVPHNAEPRLDKLIENWITPTERFYVRSHAPVPEIDPAQYRLSVGGLVDNPFSLTLEQLKNDFPQRTVVATMTCAGNRRSEHSRVRPVTGVQWQAGAIGNAEWTGVPLRALLDRAVIQVEGTHVWFEGLDRVERPSGVISFDASIRVPKAFESVRDDEMPGALVTHTMNGKPLTPDHGFPVRMVVPGYIGARSVKWLGRIVVGDAPSPNHYVATAYKLVQEGAAEEWAEAQPLETFVTNSVVCSPAAGSRVEAGVVEVKGYALAEGLNGVKVKRVEVSSDGGGSWTPAKFSREAQPYCWRLWSAPVRVTPATSALIVRATDSLGQTQPKTVDWNLKGYQFNAWHKSPVAVR